MGTFTYRNRGIFLMAIVNTDKDINIGDDPMRSLKVWKEFIQEKIKLYGQNAILYTNAGYNNVELLLHILKEDNL